MSFRLTSISSTPDWSNFKGRHGALSDFKIHHALVQLAFSQLDTQFFARALYLLSLCRPLRIRSSRSFHLRRKQQVQHAFLGSLLRAIGHFIQLFLAHHINRVSTRSRTIDSTSRPT